MASSRIFSTGKILSLIQKKLKSYVPVTKIITSVEEGYNYNNFRSRVWIDGARRAFVIVLTAALGIPYCSRAF